MTNAGDGLSFTAEDRLILAALCLDAAREPALREALHGPVDWPVLRRRAVTHGVLPLVYTRLAGVAPDLVPPETLAGLRAVYDTNNRRVLLLTADLLKVVRLLEVGEVSVITLKGMALAEQAHGDPASRFFVDLDLLVAPRDLARAQAILLAGGIAFDVSEKAPLPAHRLDNKMKRHQNYRVSPQSVRIELHWQLGDYCYPRALPVDELFARSETRAIAGHAMRVLSPADLALHLCFHGAQHYWSKLGHLADFAAVLARLSPAQWNSVTAMAREQGIHRMFISGLHLAESLLALPMPADIARMVESDPAGAALARQVQAMLARHAGSYPGMLGQGKFRLAISDTPGPALRWLTGEIMSGIVTPTDTDHRWLPLPRPLRGAYWLLRPIRQSIKLTRLLLRRKP
jgi:hypothetical protein